MTNSETMKLDQAPRHIPRSIGAVLAGMLVVIVLSLATDAILHATGIYPPWLQPMAGALWVLALAYRIPYGIAGGYVAAKLAPPRAMPHALIYGFVGLALSIVGVAMHWNKGPEFGPKWFNLSLVLTTLPCAWVGGRLREAQLRAPKNK